MKKTLDLSDQIIVCLSFDKNYAPHGDTVINSIISNCSKPHLLHFYIIHDNKFPEEVKKQITLGRDDQSFSFLEINNDLFKSFPSTLSYISINTYYRLVIQDLLPQEIERYIYIDSDVVVTGDISQIWNKDFQNTTLMAVLDNKPNAKRLHSIGISAETYFNAGFLVFNLKRIREKHPKLFNYFIDLLNRNDDKFFEFGDQDILNLAFQELSKESPEVKFIGREWNYSSGVFYKDLFYKNRCSFKSDVNYLKSMPLFPCVIHYTGKKKPWKIKSLHPLKGLYWKYRQTGNYKPSFWEKFTHSNFIFGFVQYKELSLFIFKLGNFRINLTKRKRTNT